jgi:hypothetical protein
MGDTQHDAPDYDHLFKGAPPHPLTPRRVGGGCCQLLPPPAERIFSPSHVSTHVAWRGAVVLVGDSAVGTAPPCLLVPRGCDTNMGTNHRARWVVCVCGVCVCACAGKSNLLSRFTRDEFTLDCKSTIGGTMTGLFFFAF